MNYLAHFHLDRGQREVEPAAWFAAGVAVLDLWPRFRRAARAASPGAPALPGVEPARVRAAAPRGRDGAALRLGLLRHLEVDDAFHASAAFHAWRRAVAPDAAELAASLAARPSVARLLAHVGVELALDRWLLARDPALARDLYALFDRVPPAALEAELTSIVGPPAAGFGGAFAAFVARRHLLGWTALEPVADALAGALDLLAQPSPPASALRGFLVRVEAALEHGPVRPEAVASWLAPR